MTTRDDLVAHIVGALIDQEKLSNKKLNVDKTELAVLVLDVIDKYKESK